MPGGLEGDAQLLDAGWLLGAGMRTCIRGDGEAHKGRTREMQQRVSGLPSQTADKGQSGKEEAEGRASGKERVAEEATEIVEDRCPPI